jgi:hypothetical protein
MEINLRAAAHLPFDQFELGDLAFGLAVRPGGGDRGANGGFVFSHTIADKIAASKKKAIWVGGVVPLGYEVQDRKLLVDEEEAKIVRLTFERYLALGSLPAL